MSFSPGTHTDRISCEAVDEAALEHVQRDRHHGRERTDFTQLFRLMVEHIGMRNLKARLDWNIEAEEAFMKFIDEGRIRSIEVNTKIIKGLYTLQKKGYWIQLLTARPSDNLKCLYDTYFWLRQNNVPYDSIAFSSEKYRWLADKDFFKKNAQKTYLAKF